MIPVPLATPRRMDPGVAWGSSGTSQGTTVGDVYGHRTFAAHPSNVDFHRGIDTLDDLPPTLTYANITGKVIRKNYSMFDWTRPEQYDQSTTVNPAIATYALTGSPAVLRITGVNAGLQTFPANIGRFETNQLFNVGNGTTEDWFVQLKFNTLPAGLSGEPVFGVYQAENNNYAAIWYDGVNFVVKGRDAGGVFTVDGTTGAPAGRTWLRIEYDASATSILFRMSSNGTTWTTIATETAISWTNRFIPFKAFVGFNPAAAGANDTIDIANFEWYDADGIGRFGNWITIANEDGRWFSMHASHILVDEGQYVYAATPVSYTGKTGFDDNSGRIISVHLHTEFIPNNNWTYNNDEPLNPLGPGRLPRCETYAINVTYSKENNPLGNASHKLSIVVQRSPCQRFDINRFSLTGNLATRTLNWETRAGLNPADNDATNFNGIYFGPEPFSEADTEATWNYWWEEATVGPNLVVATVELVDGTIVFTAP